jgi:hypothetical protein
MTLALMLTAASQFATSDDRIGPATGAKPVNGLKATASVVSNEIRLTLQNVSNKPLAICTWLGQRSIEVKWVGPNGKLQESHHYDWLKAVRLRNITADDFVTLKPGESIIVGPKGKDSNLKLEGAATGVHRVTVSYENIQDGKGQGVRNVWTGKVTANEVTLTIK